LYWPLAIEAIERLALKHTISWQHSEGVKEGMGAANENPAVRDARKSSREWQKTDTVAAKRESALTGAFWSVTPQRRAY
jgi:hypothetical protein